MTMMGHFLTDAELDAQIAEVFNRNRRAQTVSRTPTAAMNPTQVGREARAYIEEQRKAGREISATEAVAHIMAQNKQ